MKAALLVLVTLSGCNRLVPAPTSQPRAPLESMLTGAAVAPAGAALAFTTVLAASGDAEAQLVLGRASLRGGPALPRDPRRARAWLGLATRPGPSRAAAAHLLGVLARGHDLGPPDPAAAVHWFELAAAEGSVPAMFLLANAYRDGAGIAHDDERARYWYQAAGEHGDAEALQTLALAYRFGELSLAVDEDEARRYELEAEHALDHAR